MILKTKRLILREFKNKDMAEIVNGLNNYTVSRWMLVFPYPYTKKDAKKYISGAIKHQKSKPRLAYPFAIILREDKKLIGGMHLSKIDIYQGKAMVSYWINEKYWKNGYGSEALKALLDFGFKKLKLRRIEASTYPGNPSSGLLLQKFGFKKEGLRRRSYRCKADNRIDDEVCYGLLKNEYKPDKNKKK